MATYKQRTPYQRHTAVYSDEEDTHTVQTSASNHPTQHHGHHSHHYQAEDGILDNTSDREWTSIRNSASARARARQQQYLDQQQQRTREWQFVLSQHRHNSFSNATTTTTTTTSRGISSDEYDEVFSAAELPSIVTGPRIVDPAAPPIIAIAGEQSSILGFSDLTSDGLESLGESEDLGVWSHEDDDDVLSTPALRRSFTSSSSPLAASTTSLSHIPRPSFADSPHSIRGGSGLSEVKFQNQMPFHDGSGNFVERAPSVRESDVESERGWDSSSSRTSPVFHRYRLPKETPVRRPISSTEFKSVIQNIADLQRSNTRSSLLQSSRQRTLEGYAPSTTSSRPTFTYPHVVSKRPIFNIYESEMEDLSEMIELPVKMGWFQAFEQALRNLKPQEYEVHADDNAMSPIKAWAQHLSHDEPMSEAATTASTNVDQEQSAVDSQSDDATTANSAESQARLDQVQQNMAAASMATLKRLQTRKRANPHHRDPMQIDFTPTVTDRMDTETYRRNRRVLSRSTGTSTSTAHDTNLLAVVLSTLRRFRDHVQSNFMFSEFYDEDERSHHLSRTLGPDGDLGIEWSTGDVGGAAGERTDKPVTGTTATAAVVAAAVGGSSSSRVAGAERRYRRHERTPSVASSLSARSSVRRVNSDCGLESMRSYRSHDSNYPIHSSHYRPSLVE